MPSEYQFAGGERSFPCNLYRSQSLFSIHFGLFSEMFTQHSLTLLPCLNSLTLAFTDELFENVFRGWLFTIHSVY
jgi:hypothetical protein